MKRIRIILVISLLLSGCSYDLSRKEIDEINLIQVLGIDYGDNEYTLSALFSTGGGADSESSSPATESVTKGKGKTPYEAYENLKEKSAKSISLAQAGYYLIGEQAAENGIDRCLDFLSRDETVKMESLFFVTKEKKAADFVESAIENKQTINRDLEAIRQKQKEQISRTDNTLVNLLNEMRQSGSSVLIPYITSKESSFDIGGYTVFDENKFKDYLDRETSDGVNFIKNIIRRYPIYLEKQAGLLVYYCNTKLDSKLKGDKIAITIEIDFETLIKEVETDENIFNSKKMEHLTKEQNQYIMNLIEKSVNYSKTNGLDILQVARMVENQNAKRWKSLSSNWKNQVSNIEYYYTFNSKITKSFILGNER